MRPPLDLSCREGNDAPAYVIAMLLYCLGLDAMPQPQVVDRQLGREPGRTMEVYMDLFLLLDRGLHVCLVSDIEDSSEEFLRDGIAYLEKLFKEGDEEIRASWTPERVAAAQEREREYLERKEGVNRHQFSEVRSELTRELLDHFLADGKAIQATVWYRTGGDSNGATVLIWAERDGMYCVYDAARDFPHKAATWELLSQVIDIHECRVWSLP